MLNKIVAIVVTYNRKKILKECVDALLKQSYKGLDVCVIDNCSTDGTFEVMQPILSLPNVIYKRTKQNLGGAGGFNYGLKLVSTMGYDYIWIMDDDTIPKPEALEELMNGADKIGGTFGFLASCVLWTDGSFCKMNNPGIKKDMLYDYEYQYVREGIVNVHHASFVSILLPARVVFDVGLPIKDFFIWKDDYEYTSRISEKYRSYYIAKSIVVHKMKSNMLPDIVCDEYERISRYTYEFRNEYYLVKKQGRAAKLHYYFNAMRTLLRIIRTSPDHKLKRSKSVLKGIIQGWRFRPVIEHINKR